MKSFCFTGAFFAFQKCSMYCSNGKDQKWWGVCDVETSNLITFKKKLKAQLKRSYMKFTFPSQKKKK